MQIFQVRCIKNELKNENALKNPIRKVGDRGPHLIIVPSSTLDNWIREFSVWCPALEMASYTGSQLERKEIRIRMHNTLQKGGRDELPNVVITTYNIASSTPEDKNFVRKMPFQYVVFDEAHMLKNCATQRFEHLMRIKVGFPLFRRILFILIPFEEGLYLSQGDALSRHPSVQQWRNLVVIWDAFTRTFTRTFARIHS